MLPGQQGIAGFDPRVIPSCALWLDAADSNTITVTSGFVSRWTDKSSNGWTFSNAATSGRTGPTRVTTLNGLDVLTFTAVSSTDANGQFLGSTRNIPFNFNQHTIAFVHRPTTTVGASYGDSAVFSAVRAATQLRVPFANAFGTVGYLNSAGEYAINDVSTAYNIVVVTQTTESSIVSRNGVRQNSPVAWASTPSNNLVDCSCSIGAHALATPSNFFSGTLAEVLWFSNGLTQYEQRQVEGYLAWKWGLTSNLPATQSFSSNGPLTRPFLPTDLPDCILWFDAADTATLTLSGTQVTSWQNKGTLSSVTATNTTAAPLVASPGTVSTGYTFKTSSLNALQFPAAAYLAVSNVITSTPARTLFYIFTVTTFGDGYGSILKSSTASGNRQWQYNAWNRDTNTVILYPYGYGTEVLACAAQSPYSGTLPYDATPFVMGIRHSGSSGSNAKALSNAISINGLSVALSTNQKLLNGYYIGSDTFVLGTQPYSNVQRIGEVIQYDRALTDREMRRVEGYLCRKWGVTNADASHAYLRIPPTVPTSFFPSFLAGCQLWLDAADTATITATGSNVTSWRDKSGLGYTVSFAASPTTGTTRQNGNNVLVFSTSRGSNLSCVINAANHTLIAVHQPSAASSNTSLFRFQTGTANPYVVFPYYSASTARGWVTSVNGATLSNTGAGLPEGSSTSTYTMVMACIASASQEVFSNGVMVASNTQALTTSNMPGLTLGATTTGAEFYGGNVGELLVYSSKLTVPQRQRIEGYLAKKWAIPLPSTHPYLEESPATSDGGGAIVRRGLQQWISPDDYTVLAGATMPARVGNSFTISNTAGIATTPGGGNVFDISTASAAYLQDPTGNLVSTATTFDIWFRASNVTMATSSIVAEMDSTLYNNAAAQLQWSSNASGIPTLTVRYGGGSFDTSFVPVPGGTGNIAASSWYHAALVIPGTGTQTVVFYWNGVAAETRSVTVSFRPATRSYYALNRTTAGSANFRGQIGDLKVYSVALTADEVKQNYNAMAYRYGLNAIA